ncbi:MULTISPECIES: ABC transporter permease [Pantoea]|uniref:ABC transporter permease n=1 Tax=Pantoea sp. BJ2 TaxID=3141322 RepID=A0AAU7U3K6_9GAMM|nr:MULTISPECIES: ABC transporter permease [Pantoea]MBD9645965.1 ABC transporter permease [Pantoea sp. PNT02]PYG49236.1 peptide/nickel transport system permease protein [Pantoea sp. AG1095]QCP61810.1 ABC transporter permease [Pantoea sp. SO10]WFL69944.1 ABC transporter permease [Pantoea sp. X85]WGK59360.1 ABC transporter permease [Pantoea sp. SS70]
MTASYLLKRLLLMVYTLLVVSLLVFGITQLLPADAAVTLLGQNATPEALAAVRERLGLDAPAWQQYWHWLTQALQGNFGVSMRNGLEVAPTLLTALSRSLLLAVCALILMLIIAIPLGIWAAVRRGKTADVLVSVISYIGISFPEFVTATLVLLLFADVWQILPATGYVPLSENVVSGIQHLILPSVTVALILVAHVSRMVRSEMVDVLHTDYIRAAWLKGLSRRRILWRHALRNGLLPTITIVALDVGYLLGGIVVVEEIFAIPGIGRELIVAVQARDLPTIQAGVMILAATYSVVNFLADLAYVTLDKRISYA